MSSNSLKPFIKFMAIVLGVFFLIMFIYELNSEQKRSCEAPGCKDQPIYGSDYCYKHRANDENYETETDSQESETTVLEETMIQTAVMIIVHQTITTVIQAVTQIVVYQVAHIVTAHQVKVILQEVHQRRSTATHISLMMMDMKMFIWMMITTMTDIIVIRIMQME